MNMRTGFKHCNTLLACFSSWSSTKNLDVLFILRNSFPVCDKYDLPTSLLEAISLQKQPPEVFYEKDVLKTFAKRDPRTNIYLQVLQNF